MVKESNLKNWKWFLVGKVILCVVAKIDGGFVFRRGGRGLLKI